MRYILSVLIFLATAFAAFSQNNMSKEKYAERYNNLVAASGQDGIGIETLIGKWKEAYPEDPQPYKAGFLYYLAKAKSSSVITSDKARYLGEEPVLALKDSTGKDVYYFQTFSFDDETFGKALSEINKAISMEPDMLELHLAKISAYMAYEKDSPDIAIKEIYSLIDFNEVSKPTWSYEGQTVDNEYFDASIQELCYKFFRLAVPSGYEAFKNISERVLSYHPDKPMFMDNIGSYYLVAKKDTKKAVKIYNKVLKKNPGDLVAIQNCIIAARNDKNVKMEKKYLALLIKHTDDPNLKKSSELRLQGLEKNR